MAGCPEQQPAPVKARASQALTPRFLPIRSQCEECQTSTLNTLVGTPREGLCAAAVSGHGVALGRRDTGPGECVADAVRKEKIGLIQQYRLQLRATP